ncbi:hypothetical protein ACHHYP_03197 [Achlya hypogyna]|uniref:Uncharacterized protein n=1 Tax=Achlya hypogyna TaxID=1202772 RepID=A0A1V9Z4L5_ACHHY|nr:hypothetical protein ACHHYP_03197 [Achlya hypogyna]
MALSTQAAVLLGINAVLLLLIGTVFVANLRRHRLDVKDSYSQMITLRLAFVCVVSGIIYFLHFVCDIISETTTGSDVEMAVGEFLSSILEGIVLNSFFTLIVLQVGGSENVVRIFGQQTPGHAHASALATAKYRRYRHTLFAFALAYPHLMVGTELLSHTKKPDKYFRLVLAVAGFALICAALISVLRTYLAIKKEIPDTFLAGKKFIVIKLLLLLSTTQYSIYSFADDNATEQSHLQIYWSVCLLEVLILSSAFYIVTAPATFAIIDSPNVNPWCLWDVAQEPIPQYKPLDASHLSTTLLAANGLIVGLTAAVFWVNQRRHRRAIVDPYAQTLALRLALGYLIAAFVFFFHFTWQIARAAPSAIVQGTVGDGIMGVLEGIVLQTYFVLLIRAAGGQASAVCLLARSTGVAMHSAQAIYQRYRWILIAFTLLRPILGVALALQHRDKSQVRVVLAVLNVVLLATAVLTVIRTLRHVHSALPPAFLATQKLVVVKLLLVLGSVQRTIYNLVDHHSTEELHIQVFYTVCLVEILGLSVAFYCVSAPASFAGALTSSAPLLRLWDVFASTSTESVHDVASIEFNAAPKTPVHVVY